MLQNCSGSRKTSVWGTEICPEPHPHALQMMHRKILGSGGWGTYLMEGRHEVTDDHMLLPQVEDKCIHAFMSLRASRSMLTMQSILPTQSSLACEAPCK